MSLDDFDRDMTRGDVLFALAPVGLALLGAAVIAVVYFVAANARVLVGVFGL